MTPLNRAAQALIESLNTSSINGDLATFAVIAVLKAVWVPSPEMEDAAVQAMTAQGGTVYPEDPQCCWQAMLDVIINEGGAT